MKKIILMFIVSVLFVATAFADEGSSSSSCRIAGTANDYVEATAYITANNGKVEGYVLISNSSSKPLMSYRLVVKVDKVVTYYYGQLNWKTETMCDQTFHTRCEPYSNTRIDLSPIRTHAGYVKNVTVYINNPTCGNN